MSSVFDVDFASFDTSGDFDERIKLSDLEGSMVVMEPIEYVASIETMHGVTDAVIIAQDQVAYLKVDESILNENELNKVIAPAAGAGGA